MAGEPYTFEQMWSRLAEHAHFVAIDLPGFGHSERRDDLLQPSTMAEVVVQVIKEFGLKYPHAVGPDIGTSTLLFAAAKYPDLTGVSAMIETMQLERTAEAYAKMMAGEARFRMVLLMNHSTPRLGLDDLVDEFRAANVLGRTLCCFGFLALSSSTPGYARRDESACGGSR